MYIIGRILTWLDNAMIKIQQVVKRMLRSPHLSLDSNWPLKDAVHAENGTLWRIDDGRAHQGSEHSAIADGEGATVHVLHGDGITPGLIGQTGQCDLDVRIVHALHVADDGYHQSTGRSHGHRDVNVVAIHDVLQNEGNYERLATQKIPHSSYRHGKLHKQMRPYKLNVRLIRPFKKAWQSKLRHGQ